MQHLFVYGTLAPERPNHHILAPIDGTWRTATVRGFLHEQGWGASLDYPALVADERGEVIQGFVFSSDKLDEHWQRLDDFEGAQYQRVPIIATLDDKKTLNAFIYALNCNQLK